MTIRLSIIGAGEVGATIAYTAALRGLAKEIILVDKNRAKAVAQASDLSHGSMFLPPVEISAGDIRDCRDSHVVVITAGAKQAPGQTRLQLAAENVRMIQGIVPPILDAAPDTILLIVSNPVDILTYAALRVSGGLPPERVIGSGTVLDTSRFRSLLAQHLRISVADVHAYIVGEHGDSGVPLWSSSHIANVPLDLFCTAQNPVLSIKDRERIFREVRDAAASVIAAKGATNWAVGVAIVRILEAIVQEENAVLPVSRFLNDYHGISDICLSVPGIIGRSGLGSVLPVLYNAHELEALRHSADILQNVTHELGLS